MNLSNISKSIIFDHDGGIDDLIALMLLHASPDINLLGVTITPADCYADDACLSTLKLNKLCNRPDIPVSMGNVYGPNPFPPEWRAQPKICHSLPAMLRTTENTASVSSLPAHEWILQTLRNSANKVTFVMTGPATNLAQAIHDDPSIVDKIDTVIWMGGAIDVRGNVAMHDHDGSAEWNAYWHPWATSVLVNSGVNLVLVPLDATNSLPVDRAFLTELAAIKQPATELAGQFWAATVTAIPAYEFTYFMWDVLAASVLWLPAKSMTFETDYLSVKLATPSAGRIYRCEGAEKGNPVTWLKQVDSATVRTYIMQSLSTIKFI